MSLGKTGREIWNNWRNLPSQWPDAVQGQCDLGCVGWTRDGLQWEGPFNVPGHDFTCEHLTPEEEDAIYECLLRGELQIEKREKAPSALVHKYKKGDKKSGCTILHVADYIDIQH